MNRTHLLFTAIALFITSAVTAQIKSGDILLGASMGYSSNTSSGTGAAAATTSNSNLSPRIGLGIGTNNVLGARFNLTHSSSKLDGSPDRTSNFGVGGSIYWRHFMPIVKQFGWYFEPSAGIATSRYTQKNNGVKSKSNSTAYSVAAIPGVYYQALPKLLISVDFGGVEYAYSRYKNFVGDISKSSNVSLNLMSRFTFGVDFILGKRS